MTVAIYPGSFDPVTLGHLSVLKRAAELFDELHVLVVHNPAKSARFSAPEREALLRASIAELGIDGKITVSSLNDGLMVDAAKRLNARAIVKGFRTAGDIEYEIPMAQVNSDLSGIETVFLASEPGHGYVSSSLVKQVSDLGGDVSRYVTKTVLRALS